ncbi:MAG: DNA cytosine methyltransferase [Candidatus Thiodiazotropha sp. (ex Lucinoma aequizonata)]|nr:DNA cytosine methyltransferase [Candidatus Thiodiazotropha sp. (ex Lucinoma aequizonata)]MCU7889233.1 DNA cytosine methyltransferase [Candidatus Thiodiazotropha sp. (ex Lucinoma aequizonata)]MCU7895981.1 DNA cytosine methyltransferase [Candidatus Thiodiazotropha sp. (ex Lucinoma aequizonata)]MCU7897805.1 DNA cytosine methyltransferase [Candidatus Thiodiazotropha sp. (ex Lucinoma aequizonata)]MCU7903483.1 DNA cytosine methyltransferase [Candidatus Thiodiazotropha sp. (ex Lucinoma aequizonata)
MKNDTYNKNTPCWTFYEFFAGGGMARMGLGEKWQCLFANDFDHKKSHAYKQNWGDNVLLTLDVKQITTSNLPGNADLIWASFPCQDLSLAGGGAGLKGDRSGTFWPFWDGVIDLINEDRAPSIIVIENVPSTLTSHKGKDFLEISKALHSNGYRFGAVVIDAKLFIPQSRPRLFIIAIREELDLPDTVFTTVPSTLWHTKSLINAYNRFAEDLKKDWIWWNFNKPTTRTTKFADIIEDDPDSVSWYSKKETNKLLSMMSDINREKVSAAMDAGCQMVGAIYKRTREDENGFKIQRAEIRFDDIAGCLRTPAGGSSRQVIMIVNGKSVKSRLISSRETARLMGLPDNYKLPLRYNEAYHLTGDGVVVPVVKHLSNQLLEPILSNLVEQAKKQERKAA